MPPQAVDGPSIPTAEPETGQVPIPKWVKINAGGWAEGVIDDDSFVQAMQFLIQNRVVVVPHLSRGITYSTQLLQTI